MSAHVVPPRHYVGVFLALMALTAVTTWVAFHDFGALNNVVMLAIAGIKATMVILIFMGVKYQTKLVGFVVGASFFWLVILIGITLTDYFTRPAAGIIPG